MADPRRRDSIRTYTGRVVRPLDPNPKDIAIEDIAHSLSLQCRFTGHTRTFYSVAQHSVHVSELVPEELRLWGLLHDATEAYLSDIARPVKKAEPMLTVYGEIEHTLMAAVAEAFGLEMPEPFEVKAADNAMLLAEIRDLMPASMSTRTLEGPDSSARPEPITPWPHELAELRFIEKFREVS